MPIPCDNACLWPTTDQYALPAFVGADNDEHLLLTVMVDFIMMLEGKHMSTLGYQKDENNLIEFQLAMVMTSLCNSPGNPYPM